MHGPRIQMPVIAQMVHQELALLLFSDAGHHFLRPDADGPDHWRLGRTAEPAPCSDCREQQPEFEPEVQPASNRS